jgi:predicted nucleic acid-binding protein
VLLYLDLNCFNRPFDDQTQSRIERETDAIFQILQRIVDGIDQMVWSAALDFENSQHPLEDRRNEIARWVHQAARSVAVSGQTYVRAEGLTNEGFRPLDALHIACAEAAACDRLLTCDDRLLARSRRISLGVRVQNPIDYLQEKTDV